MYKFYKEKQSGDYLCIDTDIAFNGQYQGRALSEMNNLSSMVTTNISMRYLREECEKVKKADVPKEYLESFELDD